MNEWLMDDDSTVAPESVQKKRILAQKPEDQTRFDLYILRPCVCRT